MTSGQREVPAALIDAAAEKLERRFPGMWDTEDGPTAHEVVIAVWAEADRHASSLRADLDRAEQALKAVRELHYATHVEYPPPSTETPYCDECTNDWPCPTVTAINDAFTVTSPPHVRKWLAGAKEPPPDAAAVDDRAELQRRRDETASDG